MNTENFKVSATEPKQLKRELGWFGSTIMGLGSVLGVGIFVSLGLATEVSGSAVIIALVLAGLVVACNSLNLTQLAVNHPVSGGVYEYGYKYLNPWLGFTAGWLFLLGKMAVAATAALSFAGYLLNTIGVTERGYLVPVAEAAILIMTLVVLAGIRTSKITTLVVLSVTIGSLLFLIVAGLIVFPENALANLAFPEIDGRNWIENQLQSIALLFVAYNGAARIALLSEEVVEPRKNIPKSVIITIVFTMILYVGLAIVSLGSIGPLAFSEAARVQAAPLEVVAESFGIPVAPIIVAIGAITAMLSILLSTVLSLSRLILAMGRRGDMPRFLTQLNSTGSTPYWAVISVGIAIALLVLIGNVKTTWAFGTFGALYRCFIVALATLRLSNEERLYPIGITWIALLSSVVLAFCLDWQVWLVGLGVIGIGIIWHLVAHQIYLAAGLSTTVSEK
ncbi:amino acid permease [Kamptonema animale CS-326]|jgi:APA family basic amino acid/polyamine antiporter|uniref:APC family permease n=1 Tax=Kamptonema animale TaxID=92934 RepID=UPI00232E2693|nr:amino acid permease [Kamptonema animale]MDB9512860.1 amino acid permease [Kamptonema animale CS-326]